MIIVKFIGGLGNQIFQYAFYRELAFQYDNVKADLSDFFNYDLHNGYQLESVFDIAVPKATCEEILRLKDTKKSFLNRLRRKIVGRKSTHIVEKEFNEKLLERNKHLYLDGYWQSERYFSSVRNILRKELKFRTSRTRLQGNNRRIADNIVKSNSVSLHVRRGDYVDNNVYYNCPEEYYVKAINLIEKKSGDLQIFAFSDDIDFVENNMNLPYNVTFVDNNQGTRAYLDMYLMSLCNHNIIANSSFSWWGAWLNKNPNKIVIAPPKWFLDKKKEENHNIIPNRWTQITTKTSF